jgi:hypothetical protein
VAGAIMALGFATTPGIVMHLDDMANAPGWIWIGYLGWAGTCVAYPVWAIRVGRTLARDTERPMAHISTEVP